MLEVSIIIVINIYDGTVSIIARKCGTNWWYPCEASGVRMVGSYCPALSQVGIESAVINTVSFF